MSRETVEIVRRSLEAFARGDFDSALAAHDPAVEWRTAADEPDQQTYRGRDGVRRLTESMDELWEDRFDETMRFDEFIDRGDWVVVPWRARLRARGSGITVDVQETYAMQLAGGKIVRVEEYRSLAEALVETYLAELVTRVEAQLGSRLVGMWLFGSAALGDFDARRSDLDVQAVTTGALPLAERTRLAEALSHDALPCPVRGLEFVLYPREDLADERGPRFQLNLNTGPGMTQHAGYRPEDEPRFWFVLDVAIGREHGRPLAGPAPSEVFPVLPPRLVVRALDEALAWHRGNDPSGASFVLAAARAWAWAAEGRWLSKAGAASWAKERLDDPTAIALALARRDDPTSPPLTAEQIETVSEPAERAISAVPL